MLLHLDGQPVAVTEQHALAATESGEPNTCGGELSSLEALLVKAGHAVVVPAVKKLLADRRHRDEIALPLSELINRRTTDVFVRRKFEREVEAMADVVAMRLAPLEDLGTMPENERRAALDAVITAFTKVVASDESAFAADIEAAALAALIRARAADVPITAGLNNAAQELYERAIDECCELYVQTVIHLPSFTPRATAELLSRTTGLGEQLTQVLNRLPVRSLDAPAGTDNDERFRNRYLAHIGATLDEVELFGVNLRHYRPRTPLNVAYISLSVAEDESARPSSKKTTRGIRWTPAALRRSSVTVSDAPDGTHSVRIEQALARSARILLRGEAGSGKTTVLRWLAVNAARGTFSADLTKWNTFVPFLVVLRRYANTLLPTVEQIVLSFEALADQAPPGWVHRQLLSGRALLLVDGVDEVPAPARRGVREWLRRMTLAYPDACVIVTSRPAAAASRWLSAEGFDSTTLERMTPLDVRALIAHWHRAIAEAHDLPCQIQELPAYENALVGRLDASAHLHALATNPLLCSMLCALNLDRRTHLPLDRMSLYGAMVDLLLERRDIERGIAAPAIAVSGRDKLQLLQYLASKMSANNEAETERDIVLDRLRGQLAAMPQVNVEPAELLEHLLERSGILRQPIPGRIDFVHRTFQEYLTAREMADRADVGMLVEKAHSGLWRDTVVMAAGHANARVRDELIRRILDRSDEEPSYRRTLRLLAAASLETAPSLAPQLADRIHHAVESLVPPRSVIESRSLAGAGEPLLRHLPQTTMHLSPAAGVATVRTAALINGPGAIALLARYAADGRERVQRELARVWEYFDPHEYATSVLADAPLDRGHVQIANPQLLPAVHQLRNLRELTVEVTKVLDLDDLGGIPYLRTLLLWRGTSSRLSTLQQHHDLEFLRVMNIGCVADPSEAATLPHLTNLFFFRHPGISSLDFLCHLPRLERLGVGSLAPLDDFTPLDQLPALTLLSLERPQLENYSSLHVLNQLTGLAVISAREPKHGLGGLVRLAPNLDWLRVNDCPWVNDLTAVGGLTKLTFLDLRQTAVADLTPLRELYQLEDLTLADCPDITDLAPLARLSTLRHLDLRGIESRIDLAPLLHKRHLTIYLTLDQHVGGISEQKPKARIKYLPRLVHRT